MKILIFDIISLNTLICRAQFVSKTEYVLKWSLLGGWFLDINNASTKSHAKGDFSVNLYVNVLVMTSAHLAYFIIHFPM